MPLYDYKCDNCGETFTLMQPMGAQAPECCPECGSTLLHRLMSPSFVARREPCACGRHCDCGSPRPAGCCCRSCSCSHTE